MEMASLSLTKQEENLMNFLWDYGQPATSHDVMEKCATITWSVNYIHVMFRSLLKKGAIKCCGMVQYGCLLYTSCTIWHTWYSSVAPVTAMTRWAMTSGVGSSMSFTRLMRSTTL